MSKASNEFIEKNTKWYTRTCKNCGKKTPESYIKPIKKADWDEPFICKECLSKD